MNYSDTHSDHKVVPLAVAHTLLAICAILAICLIIALALLPADDTSNNLPDCAEDEVMQAIDFPYTDADNLTCIHIDDL